MKLSQHSETFIRCAEENLVRTIVYTFLVSKETVELRRWESETKKFGFIIQVDKGRITTVKQFESLRFER